MRWIVVTLALLQSAIASAQEPVVLSLGDLYSVMDPAERARLDEQRTLLQQLQDNGRALPKGSPGRLLIKEEFDREKAAFDDEFSLYLGIVGQPVTLHGEVKPAPSEVVRAILNDRRFGSSGLYPHWSLDGIGQAVGSNAPPPGSAIE
ncbi:MAG: hypothetical protein ACFBZ9_17845 [Sphingomonadales bacterium]